MRALIAGNWKMNGLRGSLSEVDTLKTELGANKANADVLICPPATLIERMATVTAGTDIWVGAQDCHSAVSGAHTGDISGQMLKEAGADYIIVGHSERRTDHGETNEIVKAKAEAVLATGAIPIVCVGETREERELGNTLSVVSSQVRESLPDAGEYVVAYEPVWAIGTGLVPSLDDIAEVHDAIRELTGEDVRILYGGSVKPANAAEILKIDNVNGALVGGASLKAEDFLGIISAA